MKASTSNTIVAACASVGFAIDIAEKLGHSLPGILGVVSSSSFLWLPPFAFVCGIFLGWSAKSWSEEYRKKHAHDWFMEKEFPVMDFRAKQLLCRLYDGESIDTDTDFSEEFENMHIVDYVRHETIGPEEYRWSLVPWVKEEFGKNEASLVDVRKYLDQNALSKTELDRREKEQAMMREFRSMSPDWKDYVLIALRRGSTMRQGPSSVDLEGCQFFEKVTVSDFTTKYVLTDEAKDFFGRNQALIEEYKCDSASY